MSVVRAGGRHSARAVARRAERAEPRGRDGRDGTRRQRLAAALGFPFLAPVAAAAGLRAAYRVYHPPRQDDGVTPAARGLAFQEASLRTSRDQLPLAVWVVPAPAGPDAPAPRGSVVVCHGMGRTRASVLAHVALLHQSGYHVVAYDLRNHGASGRDRAMRRMAERYVSDLADVVAFTGARPTLGGPVSVLAFSFSTWPALHLLREPVAEVGAEVAAIVCESGPALDIGAGLRILADLRRGGLPAPLRMPGVFGVLRACLDLAGRAMLGVREWPTDLDPVETRVLFIAGGRDRLVPAETVEALVDGYRDRPAAGRVSYWRAPRALHMNALRMDRADYVRTVTGFLAGAGGPPTLGGAPKPRSVPATPARPAVPGRPAVSAPPARSPADPAWRAPFTPSALTRPVQPEVSA